MPYVLYYTSGFYGSCMIIGEYEAHTRVGQKHLSYIQMPKISKICNLPLMMFLSVKDDIAGFRGLNMQ